MFTANQIVAHFVGDFILQSDWMVANKGRRWDAALVHAVVYTLPFLFITTHPLTLAVIALSHMVIDRWRLARHLIWFKNSLWPDSRPWSECKETGFPPDVPKHLSVWLMIIVDNTVHILINGAAIHWIG